MNIPKKYSSPVREAIWREFWEKRGVFRFTRADTRPVFSIDTPPPTVSGDLHLGHCYSYSHTDFIARFYRMNGYNVYYPMGFDDNGLPTERLVESRLGITPVEVGREKFIEAITEVSQQLEAKYEELWRHIGLSVDWDYTYKTINRESRKTSQYSFIDLYRKGLAYRASAPSIWCPTCRTAIAQAEIDDLERETTFVTIPFHLDDGQTLPVATTRPELLPACVSVFVHPQDERYRCFVGRKARTPIFDKEVPIAIDLKVDPEKGTGAVMCCTFGDSTDVEWWFMHKLPLIGIINPDGKLNELAGPYEGLDVRGARARITEDLIKSNLLLQRETSSQTVRIHERCDTPIEYIETKQWFIELLRHKDLFIKAGRDISWYPHFMRARYENWLQNLQWDWCISRQRYYGVPFPVWYCAKCGEIVLAEVDDLPVDPLTDHPTHICSCGSTEYVPETDVMDTWATSSVSPQIAGRWLEDKELFVELFPMSLRAQAHDIIRTWTFYTIVKAWYHFGQLPWANVAISGHGLAPEGAKISKSRGGAVSDPFQMMKRYSADAIRYWSASSGLGRDSVVSEEKIAAGQRMVTKLWNVARFTYPFLEGYEPPVSVPELLPADQWILSRLQYVIEKVSAAFKNYDHMSAKDETEAFFWGVLCDNYLEMVKSRLYELPQNDWRREAAQYTLFRVLLTTAKLLAPIMPYITEEIFQLRFRGQDSEISIHLSAWPTMSLELVDSSAETAGDALVDIASQARHLKSVSHLSMGTPLSSLVIASTDESLLTALRLSTVDIQSVTRAKEVIFEIEPLTGESVVAISECLWLLIKP